MPEAIFENVYAVSSEDSNYPATNLLKHQPGKPWKTSNIGEKSAFVILQMSQSHKITGIDIGNEHSAFIEVLVGKRACNPNDFKEILITCSFMTPPESKNSTNTNRVRCFSKDLLVQTVLNEKWDLIKIVCTQPFNRQVKYGLCFVKIHIIPPHIEPNKQQIKLEIEDNKKCLVPKKFLNKNILSSSATGTDRSSLLSSGSSVSSFSLSGASSSSSSIAAETTKRKLFGTFNLREDSPDSESENSSLSLFSRWKQSRKFETTNSSKISNAVAIRDASSPSSLQKHHDNLKPTKIIQKLEDNNKSINHHVKQNHIILDRNRDNLLFNKEDEISNSKLEKKISLDQERIKKEKEEHLKQTTKKKRKSEVNEKPKTDTTELTTKTKREETDVVRKTEPEKNKKRSESRSPRKDKNSRNISSQDKKRHSSSIEQNSTKTKKIKIDKSQEYRPFNKLLQGVTLVISGIQNPDRAELRQKALEMGAKYKPDWDSTCTHLISAFKNTPKYNQVKGHGKIVTRLWIEKCYNLKKRLPWRRYAIDDDEHEKSESEEEIHDISLKPKNDIESSSNTNNNDTIINSITKSTNNLSNDDDDDDDESDTEDELERARQIQKLKIIENDVSKKPQDDHSSTKQKNTESISKINGSDDIKNSTTAVSVSVYDLSTEEEDNQDNNNDTKAKNTKKSNSKKFFDKLKFYIVGDNVGAIEEIKLKQQILDNGGKIIDDIYKSDYVITKEPIEISSKFNGEFVKPLWVYECYDMECLIPTNRYRL